MPEELPPCLLFPPFVLFEQYCDTLTHTNRVQGLFLSSGIIIGDIALL